ncbi:MAG TPA: hypothetical protein VJ720_15365 [Chitinophaga sp.]|nr:hypothetical protein [Chitinophaga sp.]
MSEQIKVAKIYLDMINQVFEIEKKAAGLREANSIQRNVNKLRDMIEQDLLPAAAEGQHGFIYHNPLGENYNITRTDCEASIAGESTENLVITEVIKPIIRYCNGPVNIIVQKAVVVVKSKDSL